MARITDMASWASSQDSLFIQASVRRVHVEPHIASLDVRVEEGHVVRRANKPDRSSACLYGYRTLAVLKSWTFMPALSLVDPVLMTVAQTTIFAANYSLQSRLDHSVVILLAMNQGRQLSFLPRRRISLTSLRIVTSQTFKKHFSVLFLIYILE